MEKDHDTWSEWRRSLSPDEAHWLKLETSTEIISDMMAYYMEFLWKELASKKKNLERIKELDEKILKLAEEREQCYYEEKQEEIFKKVYAVYGPFLKSTR